MQLMAASCDPHVSDISNQLVRNGFVVVASQLPPETIQRLASELTSSLNDSHPDSHPLASRGTVYAARNPLDVLPDVQRLWQQSALGPLLREILGPQLGLVRGLFFDKPPGRSWWLPWHKDMTIAVKNNALPSRRFTRPTIKAGVPHVIAPVELLEQMLTVRLHLDAVTTDNGPLRVIPGSHRTGREIVAAETEPATILAQAGDALLMRPLLAHASGDAASGTTLHRRILHLEFAPREELWDGFEWQLFMRG
jgi:hypothetical protein